MANVPTKEQIAAAVVAVRRAHETVGYRRPLSDRYAEIIIWAAWCAINLNEN